MITEDMIERAAKVMFWDTYQGKPKWTDKDADHDAMHILRKIYRDKARRVLTIALDEKPVVGEQEGENDG